MKKIRDILLKNSFYTTHLRSAVRDCRFFLYTTTLLFTQYGRKKGNVVDENTVYFIVDEKIQHPGLLDFLKSVVGSYYIAKKNDFDFKIVCHAPYYINFFLQQSNHDWRASAQDLFLDYRYSRPIAYNGEGKIPRLSKAVKQYHIRKYIGFDIIGAHESKELAEVWRTLFFELFSPSTLLANTIAENKILKPYIAIHLRFVNALEKNEIDLFPPVSKCQAEHLIGRCMREIEKIKEEYPDYELCIFSDSNVFLDRVNVLPVYVSRGRTGHIAFANDRDVIEKSYRDFYLLSQAEKIIRFYADEMYPSAFSEYAAILGNIPCYTRNV